MIPIISPISDNVPIIITMELETENITNSIKIPLSASDEYIQLFVDELEDDPTSLISLLFDEYVPPKYWIQIAVYVV